MSAVTLIIMLYGMEIPVIHSEPFHSMKACEMAASQIRLENQGEQVMNPKLLRPTLIVKCFSRGSYADDRVERQ